MEKLITGFASAARLVFFGIVRTIFKIGIPPRVVPENLSAKKYYRLGVNYKLAGWISQSKQSFKMAIKLDPAGIGKDAEVYLKAYLPLNDIPEEAVTENIRAVNISVVDKARAEKMYRGLMVKYPTFEWPYGNLGCQLLQEGRLEDAKAVLNVALMINPHYANGLIHLAAVHLKEKDEAAADKMLLEVLQIDPNLKSNILETYPELVKRLKKLKTDTVTIDQLN